MCYLQTFSQAGTDYTKVLNKHTQQNTVIINEQAPALLGHYSRNLLCTSDQIGNLFYFESLLNRIFT